MKKQRDTKGTHKQQQSDSSTNNTSTHCHHVYQVSTLYTSQFLRKMWSRNGEKEKWIKGWISSSTLIQVHTIHLPTVHVCTKFHLCMPHNSWEKSDENIKCSKIGEKEKGRINSSSLIPVYTIHPFTVHVCTMCVPSFNTGRHHSSWEKCDKNFHPKGLQNDGRTNENQYSTLFSMWGYK